MQLRLIAVLSFLLYVEGFPSMTNSNSQYVVGGAVEVIDVKISPMVAKDILQSTLYAQMMANHDCDRYSEFSRWYQTNIKTFEEIGWSMSASEFELHIDNHSSGIEEATQSALSSNMEKSELDDIHSAFSCMQSNATVANMFNEFSSKGNFSNFQILILKLDSQNDIIMSYAGLIINTVQPKLRQVFVSLGLGILSTENYSAHREDVSLYLGDYTSQLVKMLQTK